MRARARARSGVVNRDLRNFCRARDSQILATLGAGAAGTAPTAASSNGSNGGTTAPDASQKEKAERYRKLLNDLPDLSYMLSKVLVLPRDAF